MNNTSQWEIEQILTGDNYIYLFVQGSEAVVVDPLEAAPVLDLLEGRNLRCACILNTHNHWDHTGGNEELKEKTGCLVVGPDQKIPAVDRIAEKGANLDEFIPDLQVLPVPGHTPGSVAYHIPFADVVFTGDTLFAAGCGRLMGCSADTMHYSLMRLAALPPQTLMYCGHEYTLENLRFAALMEPRNDAVRIRLKEVESLYEKGKTTMPSTIGLEKETNPFLRVHSADIRRTLNMDGKSPVEVFAELRRRKDVF